MRISEDDLTIRHLLASARQCVADGLPEIAKRNWQDALAIRPNNADLSCNVAIEMHECNMLDDAIALYIEALQTAPQVHSVLNNLGIALRAKGEHRDALKHLIRAHRLVPSDPDIATNLGNAYKSVGKYDLAVAAYKTAIAARPQADAHINLGNLFLSLGNLDLAEAEFGSALDIDPMCAKAESNVLFLQSHRDCVTSAELIEGHKRFGLRYRHLARQWSPRDFAEVESGTPLRIGFVSADLREHPVASLLIQLWTQLAADGRFRVIGYCASPEEDRVSQQFKAVAWRWRNVSRMSDAKLADYVQSDRVNILIDLSGHTGLNRLPAFALKPAPVQVSWLGYPFSTGLEAIDYYICDEYWIPPGSLEECFVEKLVRLPVTSTFQPCMDAPEVGPLPRLTNGRITFASFNRPSKINSTTILDWANILHACENSSLMVGSCSNEEVKREITQSLEVHGISTTRLQFKDCLPVREYLDLHNQADVLLDCRPYSGGTTTLHGAWMGCPTLTLAGQTPFARQSAAIMEHLGLESFIAADPHELVNKAQAIAADPVGLSNIREGLRIRMRNSAICNPQELSRTLAQALLVVWDHWLSGNAPRHFLFKRP